MKVQLHTFLTSALDGEWFTSRPGRFIAGEKASHTTGWGTEWASQPV